MPWAVPSGIGHGCNTPCIEITDERTGAVLLLDAGSGIVGVGPGMIEPTVPIALLLTHYHWDHLQGLPFFEPFYRPGWETAIYSPALLAHDPGWLEIMFRSPFFPVPYQHLPNRPRVELVNEGELNIPGFEISALPLNHPGGALAYRIRGVTGDFVYATDHEFGDPEYDKPLADVCRGRGRARPRRALHAAGAAAASRVGAQRLAALRRVRRRQRHRRSLALSSQAWPDRRGARAHPHRRPPHLSRDRDRERRRRAAAVAADATDNKPPTTLTAQTNPGIKPVWSAFFLVDDSRSAMSVASMARRRAARSA